MNYPVADRVKTVKPSAIREILKLSATPGMIPFSAGNPSADTFPNLQMADIAHRLLSDPKTASGVLQYGISEGYQPLRDITLARLQERYQTGTACDEIIMTSGGQQVTDLFAKSLLNPGDTVIVEGPSFLGSLNCFKVYEANIISVPMASDGMDIGLLEQQLKTQKNVKFIYVISTFQNPSGYTTSLEKRRAILNLAKKYDVMILEDSPYFELRFAGQHVPSIKSLDDEGRVMYAGSYSKILSPGMRIGFAVGGKDIINRMIVCKQVADVHPNQLAQVIAHEYLTHYDLDAHIQKACAFYRDKCALMVDALKAHLPQSVTFEAPQGGLFIWCDLPEGKDGVELYRRLVERKVAIIPGNCFMVDEDAVCRGFRLNFSMPSREQIAEGVEILGEVTRQYLG